jgi:hypothetical protein
VLADGGMAEHADASRWRENHSWIVLVGDMLERLSRGYWVASPHRVPPTPPDAAMPRRSIVFFLSFDEEEAVAAIPSQVARRSITGGYRHWDDERQERDAGCSLGTGAATEASRPMTQREWTEWKESAARERLRQREARESEG